MSRFGTLLRSPRRTLAVLATVLTAVGLTVASGASFTASSANPSNTFSAGTLSMSNSKDNVAILTATEMGPGAAAAAGTVDIANTGSLSGEFTLARGTLVDSDTTNRLSSQLNVTVEDCGPSNGTEAPLACTVTGSPLYSGRLDQMGTATTAIALGPFAVDAMRRYRFSVGLDAGAGDVYQGASTNVEFTFNAAS